MTPQSSFGTLGAEETWYFLLELFVSFESAPQMVQPFLFPFDPFYSLGEGVDSASTDGIAHP